jgi:hypothetical protein
MLIYVEVLLVYRIWVWLIRISANIFLSAILLWLCISANIKFVYISHQSVNIPLYTQGILCTWHLIRIFHSQVLSHSTCRYYHIPLDTDDSMGDMSEIFSGVSLVAAFFLVFYFQETYNRWTQMKQQMLISEGQCLTQLMLIRSRVF